MKSQENRIALLVPEKEMARTIPRRSCARVFSRPDTKLLEHWQHVLVLVSWAQLENVTGFIKEANVWGNLRGILLDVEDQQERDLLPIYLNHVRMRSLRNLIVHEGPEVPNRIVNAYCIGAESELIADAVSIDDELFVVSCSAETYKVSFNDIAALKRIPEADRSDFYVEADGSYVAWPAYDVHLDLESIRVAIDNDYRERSFFKKLSNQKLFGLAVAELRNADGLRQTEFEGLSERQVRRIEHGEGTSLESIRLLAGGHGMNVNEYLNAVAALMSKLSIEGSDSKTKTTMSRSKVTGKRAATSGSKTLSGKGTGKKSQTAAGSALSKRKARNKTTPKGAATSASKVVRDKRTGKASKSAAGSALSQKAKKTGKKRR